MKKIRMRQHWKQLLFLFFFTSSSIATTTLGLATNVAQESIFNTTINVNQSTYWSFSQIFAQISTTFNQTNPFHGHYVVTFGQLGNNASEITLLNETFQFPTSLYYSQTPTKSPMFTPTTSAVGSIIPYRNSSNSTAPIAATYTIYALETQVNQSTIQDYTPVCPGGLRYYWFDVPADGYAYNFTITAMGNVENLNISYENIYVRGGGLVPDPSLPNGGGMMVDTSTVVSFGSLSSGFTFENLYPPGRYWMAFQCDVESTSFASPVSYSLIFTRTCLIDCFRNGGTCAWDGPAPYCVCGFFYSGEKCLQLWTGVYTLIVVGAISFVLVVTWASCKVYRMKNPKHVAKKRRVPLSRFEEAQPLVVNK